MVIITIILDVKIFKTVHNSFTDLKCYHFELRLP